MRKEFDAWSTLDMEKVAPFYAQGPDYVFYDLTPLKYSSWADYAAGVKKILPDLTSIKFTIHDDAQTHQHGHLAWGTATMLVQLVTKEGKHEQLEARWTAIWEKQGKNWVIVHEHFSAPVP
jgi:ketosteroid isomerase-like protein